MLRVASFSLKIRPFFFFWQFGEGVHKTWEGRAKHVQLSALHSAVEGTAFSVSDDAQCQSLVYGEEFKAQMVT